MPDAPRFAHEVRDRPARGAGDDGAPVRRNWPAGGGGYFRLLPYAMSRWSLRRVNARRPAAGDLLLPPVGDRPRAAARQRAPAPKTRFRHYLNLDRTEPRLRRLLADFRWDRVDRVFLERRHADGTRRPPSSPRRARRRPRRVRRVRAAADARALGRVRRSAAPRRRSSIAPAGGRSSRASSATAPTSCIAERDGADRRRAAAGRGQEPAVRPCARLAAVLRLRRRRGRATPTPRAR